MASWLEEGEYFVAFGDCWSMMSVCEHQLIESFHHLCGLDYSECVERESGPLTLSVAMSSALPSSSIASLSLQALA